MNTAASDLQAAQGVGAGAPRAIKPFFLDLTEAEIEELQSVLGDILRRGELILGRYTEQFEREFAAYVGAKYAASLNTGTSALEVLLWLKGAAGKRVAVPSNTNFACVAAIMRSGATPVFLDMTEEYFVPNLPMLRTVVERHGIDGVMWVHIGGIIAPDFPDVVDYCRSRSIFLIEDAAHAHGSKLNGVRAGNFGDGAAFSFFPTKVMTTMEGGLITTNDEGEWRAIKSFRNQGKRDGNYGGKHYDLGSSWRMSELSAYMGLVQLRKLDRMISARSAAAGRLANLLKELRVDYCDTSHMDAASTYKFIVKTPDALEASAIRKRLSDLGVHCGGGVYEIPCHLQPVFKDIQHDPAELANTEKWCPRHICPPITSGTSDTDIEQMMRAMKTVFG